MGGTMYTKLINDTTRNIPVLFLIGALGFSIPAVAPFFNILIPLFILFNVFFIYLTDYRGNRPGERILFTKRAIIFIPVVGVVSFVIECVGVNTGFLFGTYRYLPGLGIGIEGTPLLIGVNWIMLLLVSASVVNRFQSRYLRIFSGALLMTLSDLLIEQVCASMNMWYWLDGSAPLRNYISWFVIALFFHTLREFLHLRLQNKAATIMYVSLILFFGYLTLYFHFISDARI